MTEEERKPFLKRMNERKESLKKKQEKKISEDKEVSLII